MKKKVILLCIIILQLLLFTIFCPDIGETSSFTIHKIESTVDNNNSRGGSSIRVGNVQSIGFTKTEQFEIRQFPTKFRNRSNKHIYKQNFVNSQASQQKYEANYAVLPNQNNSSINQQEVGFSDLNSINNTEIYSSTKRQEKSPQFNMPNSNLALLSLEIIKDKSPETQEEANTKSQHGFLALSTTIDLENTGIGEATLEERRLVVIDPDGDPEGPPIPIPDGFWVLLMLAISYTGWIFLSKSKSA